MNAYALMFANHAIMRSTILSAQSAAVIAAASATNAAITSVCASVGMTMRKPDYERDGVQLHCCDCRELLETMEPESVDAVVPDPPYCGVLEYDWDNQREDENAFLAWSKSMATAIERLLSLSGTVYWFTSSRMAAKIETMLNSLFSIVSSCVWYKGKSAGAGDTGIAITSLRRYSPMDSERIIVCEKRNASEAYENADAAIKRKVIGDYLRAEIESSGASFRDIANLFPSKSGRITGCVSNWLLGANFPTKEQYEAIRRRLKAAGHTKLLCEYEHLRSEYERLRGQCEGLRRPFFLNKNHEWGTVWCFSVPTKREHPCQKPIEMFLQIIDVSSRESSIIIDPFMGSGTTGVAAVRLGRKFIGCEIEPKYFDIAVRRIEAELNVPPLPFAEPEQAKQLTFEGHE